MSSLSILRNTLPQLVARHPGDPRLARLVDDGLALLEKKVPATMADLKKIQEGEHRETATRDAREKLEAEWQQRTVSHVQVLDDGIAALRARASKAVADAPSSEVLADFVLEQLGEMSPLQRDGFVRRAMDLRIFKVLEDLPREFNYVTDKAIDEGKQHAWQHAYPDAARELQELQALREAFEFVADSVRRAIVELLPHGLVARQPASRL